MTANDPPRNGRPAVTPEQRAEAQHGAAAAVEVGLVVARHHLYTLVDDSAPEVARSAHAASGSHHHASAAVEHVASDVVEIGSGDAARASHHNVIGGVDAVATRAVGAQQVVPAVAPDEVGGLAVDGDVLLAVACHACARRRVELDEAYGAEVGAVGGPEASCGGVEQQRGVDGVLVFHAVAGGHLHGLRPAEVGRRGVERRVPHGEDAAVVAAAETAARGTIDAEIAVANLQHVGGSTAARAFGTAAPRPAVG